MNKKYIEWISTNYPTPATSKNKCNVAVTEMIRSFAELKLCVGKVKGIFHCWLVDVEGSIVDPTVSQFDFEPSNEDYELIAHRFLERHEFEPSTGAVFISCEAST